MLGNKIRQLREERDWTQKDLAKKMDKSQKTISSWEKGRTNPKVKELHQLCSVFGCTYETLTGIKQHDTQDITFDDVLIRVSTFDLEELGRLKGHVTALIRQQEDLIRIEREKEKLEEELRRLQKYKDMITNNKPPEGNNRAEC